MNVMNILLQKILLAGFCFFALSHVYGQPGFSATISPAAINKDEYATLRIVIENANDIQQLTPPNLKNFTIVSGPNQESGMSSVNGNNIKQYVAVSFVLKPKQPGSFNIDPSVVKIAGKMYKSNTVKLLVKNATSGKNTARSTAVNPFAGFDPFVREKQTASFNDYIFHKGDNIADKVNKNMQLRLETDKTSCYVGEPVVASYKLYTRLKSESKLTQNPSFNGFSVIDLQQPNITGYTQEKLNGKEYNVYTIRKAQLYPLQAGNIELEPAELENNIQFIKEDYANRSPNDVFDMFDDFAQSAVPADAVINETVSLKSKPVTIVVKPLPETNKPASFKGAVGNFTIESTLEKNNFTSDEAGKFTIIITGNGNLQLVTAPEIAWHSGIEPFEPKVTDDLIKTTVPVSGKKVFEYSFSVNVPGNYTIPPLLFSYFDPKTATYKTINTNPVLFDVSKGTGKPVVTSQPVIKKDETTFMNNIFNHRRLLVSFIACVILIGLIIWLKRDNKKMKIDAMEAEKKMNTEDEQITHLVEVSAINQQNPLSESEKCLYRDDCPEFYAILNKELKDYLAHKFLVNSPDINSKKLSAAMDKKGIANDTVLKLEQLMHDVEWQLYTPFEKNEKLQELYHRSHGIIQEINSYETMRL